MQYHNFQRVLHHPDVKAALRRGDTPLMISPGSEVGGAIRGVGVVRVEDGVVDGTNERHGHRDDEDAAVGWGGGGQWGGCSRRRQQRSVNERESE